MTERIFYNPNQISAFVIQKRLRALDPFGTARIYSASVIGANYAPTGQTRHYIAIDSDATDSQLEAICSPPLTNAEQNTIARFSAARSEASLTTQLKALTPQQAVDYIETNVTTLATAKIVLEIVVRMLIALRDEVWPDMPE
jgi:hypothetical protein